MNTRLWTLTALLATAACSSDLPHSNPYDPQSPPTVQAKARLVGTVSFEGLGEEADRSGARIVVPGLGAETSTVADGSWALDSVPPGTWSVEAFKDGYTRNSVFPVVVELSSGGGEVGVAEIALRRARGVLRGQATLEGEESFGGITVLLSAAAGSAQTDPQGNYVVSGVPTGTYEVTLSKLAFRQVQVGNAVVAADGTTELPPVTLASNPGSISGRVLVRGAADNGGVLITADGMTLGGRRNVVQVTTSVDPLGETPDGTFTLSNVAAGLYNVSFAKENYLTRQSSVSVAPEEDSALPVVELVAATGAVAGTARLENGLDHSGIQVSLTPRPTAAVPAPTVAGVALTGGGGAWRIEGLAAGDYDALYRRQPGYADATGTVTVVRDAVVVAAAAELAEIPGLVEGRVLFEGFDPAGDLSGTSVAVDTGAAQTTDAEGRFSLEAAAGAHVLRFHREGFREARVQVAVAAGYTVALDDQTLSRARGKVHGTLLVEGRPADASGVLVTLSSATEGAFTALTDRAGAFRFAEVPVGPWRLDASLASYAELPSATVQVVEDGDLEAPASSGPIAGRTLALRRDASLGGQVALELGLSPTTASAKLVGLDVNGAPVEPAAQAPDASGGFLFDGLPPGSYRVELSEPEHEKLELPSVMLSAGQSVALSSVRMARARGGIAGRYQLALATSHEGVQVTAKGTGVLAGQSASALTDANGAFGLGALPVGSYAVTASKGADWEPDAQPVVVTRDAVAGLQNDPELLAVVATGSVSGVARLEGLAAPELASTVVGLTGKDFRGQPVNRPGTTAADGSYLFEGLVAGDYQLRFERAGFETLSGVVVRVPSPMAVQAGEVQLSLSRGAVHGVLLVAGRPSDASGVLVTLSSTTRPSLTALTDASGAFRFSGVPVGSWSLDASLASYTGIPTAAVAVAANLDVEAPASSGPIAGRTLALRREATISGSALLASGAAAQGVGVELSGSDLNGAPVSATATTTAAGSFSLATLPPGSYRLTLALVDHEPVELGPVALAAGQTATLSPATLQRSRGNAAGQFLLTGAASHENVRVTLTGTGSVAGTSVDALTGTDGRFVATGLPVGTYDVHATRTPDWTPRSGALTVLRNQTGQLINSPLSLQVIAAASVAGKVTVDKGVSAGTQVRLRGEELRGQAVDLNAVAAADGSFWFPNLVGGSYQLTYERANYETAASSLFAVASGAAVLVPDLVLRIARGELVGSVRLSGASVPGFEVGADWSGVRVELDDESGVEIASTISDGSGAFKFTNVAVASITGQKHQLKATREHFSQASLEVAVLADGSTSVGPLELGLQPGSMTGQAYLHDKVGGAGRNPDSTGVEVSVTGVAYNGVTFSKAGGQSAADGSWSLAGLPPGTFEVHLSSLNRRCEGGGSFPVRAAQSTAAGDADCYDTLAPGALVLAALPAWTSAASLAVALSGPATDPTQPASNLRGYQYVRGRLPNWSEPEGLAASGPFSFALEANAENTLWVRAIDWLGNPGPESYLTVRHDGALPARPAIYTPRSYLNTTTTSVSLSGAEGDSSFDTYLACSAELPPALACPLEPSCAPVPSAPSFALSLTSGKRTCLWAQSRDLAGNLSPVSAPATVLCDLSRPAAPVISPVYEASAFTVRAKSVDVFVSSYTLIDLPLGNASAPLKGFDHLEIDSGAGFVPLCPECRDAVDPEVWDPCSDSCACEAMVQCATVGRRSGLDWVTASELRSLRVPLVDGTTNRISVRGVDLAGNVGDGASITVGAEGMRIFAQGAGTQGVPRFNKGSVAFVDAGSVRFAPLDAGRTPSAEGCLIPSGSTDYLRSRSCESQSVPEVLSAFTDRGLAVIAKSTEMSRGFDALELLPAGAACPAGAVPLKTLPEPGSTRLFTSVAASGKNLGWVETEDWESASQDEKEVFTCQLDDCESLTDHHSLGVAAGPGHMASLRAGGDYLLWAAAATVECPAPKYRWKLAYVAEAPGWVAAQGYQAGAIVWPQTPNGHAYRALTDGVSGAVPPAWPTDPTNLLPLGPGPTVVDGGLSWQELSFSFEAEHATLSADGKLVLTADNTGELTWQPSTSYSYLQLVHPTVPNGFVYFMWSASGAQSNQGLSGATEPLWPTATNATVADGELTWFALAESSMGNDKGNAPAIYRVREIGADRLWGTSDDTAVENRAIGELAEGGLAIEAGRAVAVSQMFDRAITVWDAAPDGSFQPDPAHLRHLVAKGGQPGSLELDQGLLVYSYGSDLVSTDLSTLRWESAVEWEEHPLLAEDGTILFVRGGAERTFVARAPDGSETAGIFPGYDDFNNDFGPALTGKDLLLPSSTGLDLVNAGPDGRLFTADDTLPVQLQASGSLGIRRLATGGGNAVWTLGDDSSSSATGYVLLSAAGASLAGSVPVQIGAAGALSYMVPAISDRFVAWSLNSGATSFVLQYIEGGALGEAVELDCLHFAALLGEPSWCSGANWRVNPRQMLASGPKLLIQLIPDNETQPRLVVLDPGPNGRFGSNLDLLELDDRAVQVPIGPLVVEKDAVAIGGDGVSFVASAPGLSAQLYSWRQESGAVLQRTFHFSEKSDVRMAASGRTVWSDTLFDSRSVFVWLP